MRGKKPPLKPTRLEPKERSRRLQDDPASRPETDASAPVSKTNTVHSRRWRARERAGLILLKFPADEAEVVVALTDRGLLDPVLADDRAAINEAARRAFAQFCGEISPHEQRLRDTMRIRLLLASLKRKLHRGPSKR
jgi:hypothetical protein